MTKQRDNLEAPELGKLWASWTIMVARLLRKRRRSLPLSATKYQQTHGKLLVALDNAVKQLSNMSPLREADLRELQEFCHTWVSLDALQAADRRVLRGVVRRCEELCFRHFGLKPTSRLVEHAIQLLAVTSLLTIVLAGTVGKSGALVWDSTISTELRSQVYRGWFIVGQYSGLQWLGIATGVVVIVGIGLLSSPQKY